jgi:hypothetical protein
MTQFLRCAALGLAGLGACSGKSVDLEQPMAASGSSGAGGSAAAAELVFEQHGTPLLNKLLVDDTRLYWQTEDSVFQSCLKSGCQHSVITYSKNADQNGWSNVAVSAGQVFWQAYSPRGEIDSCPRAGCAGKPTRLIRDPDMNFDAGITSQNGDVYWRSTFDLYRCAASGCGQAPAIVDLGERDIPQFDGAYAYWIDSDLNTGSTFIRRAPLDGSSPAATLYEITDTPRTAPDVQWLAIAGDRLYWTDRAARVLSCPSSGCSGDPTLLDSSMSLKGYLEADSAGVYWIEGEQYPYDSNSVHFCPSAGCASGSSALTGLGVAAYALDADSLYYIDQVSMDWNGMGGQIHRVARP